MHSRTLGRALGVAALMTSMTKGTAGAQVPADIEAGLLKIGPEVFSIDTADKTVSGPILAWMKRVK
jgi:hypothetical protein